MNKPKGKQSQGRRRRAKKQRPIDLWRPVTPLPPPAPIAPADDPTALLRSLGTPPLHPRGTVAEHYMATVLERAAGLATALAASADLLAPPDDEGDDDPSVAGEPVDAA
jgi:hypothetical protein